MRFLSLVLLLTSPAFVFADRLTLVNGDRITGELVELVDGRLVFKSPVMGTLMLDWEDVSSLETDEVVRIALTNGEELKALIVGSGPYGLHVLADGRETWIKMQDFVGLNQPVSKPAPTTWEGALSSSLSVVDSNRDAQNFNLDFDITRERATDRLTAKAAYAFASQSVSGGGNETTVDSWFTRGQYDVIISEKFFWLGSLRLDRDRVSHLDLRTAIGAGAGYTFWNKETSAFRTTFGLSYLREAFTVGGGNNTVVLQIGTGLRHEFSSRLTVLHDTSYFPNPGDLGDFFLSSELVLRSALASNMFGEIKFVFDYDATPAPGAQKGNYRYTMGVGMRF
ncbi:MAG: DUF481 domain-containing protein [Armatimonadetes bacterium]|nr:DUF481 domain-containing protein [Armatimonadota bacterium]